MGFGRKRLQELDDGISHRLSRIALDLFQEIPARFSLRQGDNGMTTSFADNRIHFPVTQTLASIHYSGPFVDTHSVLELVTPIIAPIALPALRSSSLFLG